MQDLSKGVKTVKLLEENIDINLHDRGLGNGFLHMTSKVQAAKIKIDQLVTLIIQQ